VSKIVERSSFLVSQKTTLTKAMNQLSVCTVEVDASRLETKAAEIKSHGADKWT
jgi:hypothetical protein